MCFSRTRFPDDAQGMTLRNFKADIAQGFFFSFGIRERQGVDVYGILLWKSRYGTTFFYLGFHIKYLVQSAERRHAPLNNRDYLAD